MQHPLCTAHFPFWKKIICGSISGVIGAAIATPTDVVKVRMQADVGQPPRYRSTWEAFKTIAETEGVRYFTY